MLYRSSHIILLKNKYINPLKKIINMNKLFIYIKKNKRLEALNVLKLKKALHFFFNIKLRNFWINSNSYMTVKDISN